MNLAEMLDNYAGNVKAVLRLLGMFDLNIVFEKVPGSFEIAVRP